MSTKNLWGNIEDYADVRPPHELLEEQGKALSQITDGKLVLTISRTQSNTVYNYDAFISLATAKQVRQRILRLTHDIKLYPALIFDDEGSTEHRAENQEDFEEKLGRVLSSEGTMRVVATLMTQARLNPGEKIV